MDENPITDTVLQKKILLRLKQLVTTDEKMFINKLETKINSEDGLCGEECKKLTSMIETHKVDIIQTMIDDNVRKYKKYTSRNPMNYVVYNDKQQKWRITTGKQETFGKIEDIREFALGDQNELVRIRNPDSFTKSGDNFCEIKKNYFRYSDKYFMCYWYAGDPHFDIEHVVSVLNLDKDTETKIIKKHDPVTTLLDINEYGGYIKRNLINENTMYKIILNSRSSFSKTFQESVANILIKLRRDNALVFENNDIKVKSKKYNSLPMDLTEQNKPYTYRNKEECADIKRAIYKGKQIDINEYTDEHVLYAVLMIMGQDNDDAIIKFGYSENIIVRLSTLRTEYGSEVYLLGIKKIHGESEEKRFHSTIKNMHDNLIYDVKKSGKRKTELYYFNPKLMEVFDNYESNKIVHVPMNDMYERIIKMQSESNNILNEKNQEIYNLMYKVREKDIEIAELRNLCEKMYKKIGKVLDKGLNDTYIKRAKCKKKDNIMYFD